MLHRSTRRRRTENLSDDIVVGSSDSEQAVSRRIGGGREKLGSVLYL
jgi:hypothetical protein